MTSAHPTLERVIAIYKDGDPDDRDLHLAGRTLVEKACAEIEKCAPEWAIPLLREAEPLLDRERDPRLLLCLRHNLLDSLAKVGSFAEADTWPPRSGRSARKSAGTSTSCACAGWRGRSTSASAGSNPPRRPSGRCSENS